MSTSSPLCVVDTPGWVECLIDSPLGRKMGVHFLDQTHCIAPTLGLLELDTSMAREVGEDEADQMLAYTPKCLVAPLETHMALLAASLQREHKLTTADSIVHALAHYKGAQLIPCDAHFAKLPQVTYFAQP